MAIQVGDIITINYVERCDGIVIATNIEQVARDNDILNENAEYSPIVLCVGHDFLGAGLHEELVGKEVGAKGTVLVSAEKAYGERNNEKVNSLSIKQFEKGTKVGDSIRHSELGIGLIVNKIGQKFIVDFNDRLAGRDIEYEYQICEIITDPNQQFIQMMRRFTSNLNVQLDISCKDGKGTLHAKVPLGYTDQWVGLRGALLWEIFGRLSSLESIEFHEEYTNIFNLKPVSGLDLPAEDDAGVLSSDSDSSAEGGDEVISSDSDSTQQDGTS